MQIDGDFKESRIPPVLGLVLLIPAISSAGEDAKKDHQLQSVPDNLPAVLWVQPASIANRDPFHREARQAISFQRRSGTIQFEDRLGQARWLLATRSRSLALKVANWLNRFRNGSTLR